jgi:hypothetical protein
MKTLLLCAGLLCAVAANAETTERAVLIGQHVSGSFAGNPLLICEYSGARARFEILSQNGACAPFLYVQ